MNKIKILELNNIKKAFGENHVLNGIDLSFVKGRIYSLVGGNGSGKSTIFNLVSGFQRVDNGVIKYNSKNIQNENPVKINSLGISRTFQDLRLIYNLSVRENILLSFKYNPGEKLLNSVLPPILFRKTYADIAGRANDIIEKIHLSAVQESLASEISYGQQKLLSIGCCLANDASLLLLDEPIAGIDKDNYKSICNLLAQLRNEGKTIIFTEHSQDFIRELSQGIYFLNSGKVQYFNDYEEFVSDELIKQVYLT